MSSVDAVEHDADDPLASELRDGALDQPDRASHPAPTTSSTPSTMPASRFASEIRPTGGVSTITQSKSRRALRSMMVAHPVGGQTGHRVGSGRPAGRTVRYGETCDVTAAESVRRPSARRPARRVRQPEHLVNRGRRRSASISSTRRLYDSLSVKRQIGRGQRLAFARQRARHHERCACRSAPA